MIKTYNIIRVTVIILLLAGLALGGFWVLKKVRNQESLRKNTSSFPAPQESPTLSPLPVRVARATVADLEKRIKAPGEVYTEKKVVLKAEVSGVLKKLHVQEGQGVRAGQLLAELDETPYRLEVEQNEASRLKALSELLLDRLFQQPELAENTEDFLNLKKAEESWKKAEKAFQEGLISQKDLEKAQRDYELALIGSGLKREEIIAASKGLIQAEVSLKISRMKLEKTRIAAPFSGRVTLIKVAPGENIEIGRELMTVVNLSSLKVEARILESEIGKIKVGREAAIHLTAYPGRIFLGRVAAISPLVNPAERTCSVFIHLDNPTEEIKPGMHAEVEIVSEIFPKRLLVPQEAVLVRGGRPLVFVVEGGVAKWRYIKPGEENERFVEVLEGVSEGEQVIVEGHLTLAHDSAVRVLE
jgi:RND family efflux transporter MFP subunit